MEPPMDVLQKFIYLRTYARFLWEENRRETYPETVDRFCKWAFKNPLIPEKVKTKSRANILKMAAMPSMRALWTAGPAAERDNTTIYNCAFLAINDLNAFGETLINLMAGCGVGFSAENHHISKLPKIKFQRLLPPYNIVVKDSRRGWKDALDMGIESWFNGRDCYFDFSQLRPMGEPLMTMGGRSSGPEVLRELLRFARETVLANQGKQLSALECHDMMCEIARIVIVGGTRRAALISLSDLNNDEIRQCKNFKNLDEITDKELRAKEMLKQTRRFGANNSAVYYSKPDIFTFLDEWSALGRSGRGERGIANIGGARRNAPHRRKSKLIEGVNPCGEVALRDRQFCNLSEAVVRPEDDFESLRDKLTTAAWLSVIQATHINFPHLSPAWKENCEDERLCGVSLTGQFDNPSLLTPEVLKLLKGHVVNVCKKAAKILDINIPAAVTSMKPSGTLSQVVNCSPGLHPRWSPFYIRNIQIAVNDPLFNLMRDQDVPFFIPEGNGNSTAVLSFPVASPKGAITKDDLTAKDQLEWYEKCVENYTEHAASCTVYVGKDEWLTTANWVYDHFEKLNGLSFFPREEGKNAYAWTPYQEISEEEYNRLTDNFPDVDFSRLPDYENTDQTTGAKELACAGGACEL